MNDHVPPPATFQLTGLNTVVFLAKERARQFLSTADQYAERLTLFDRSVRMKADRTISTGEFLEFAGRSALDWSPAEVELITGALADIRAGLCPYAHLLPAEILLIKTTGAEEFNSAYTRQNAIILPLNKLDRPRDRIGTLLAHELFHIISRYRPELRESLYTVVGFHPCGKIRMPRTLVDRTLTNPDTPDVDYTICLEHEGKPVHCVPLFSFKDGRCDIRHGEAILQYLEVKFLAVEQDCGCWRHVERSGRPLLIKPCETSGFHEQVGRNTDYDICAEEILAENFMLLVTGRKDVPSPRILEKMEALLLDYQ